MWNFLGTCVIVDVIEEDAFRDPVLLKRFLLLVGCRSGRCFVSSSQPSNPAGEISRPNATTDVESP